MHKFNLEVICSNVYLINHTNPPGGFLKVYLSILTCKVIEPKTKFSFKDSLTWDKFKDGGVKKLIILGFVEDFRVNNLNIKKIVDTLGIRNEQYFLAFDLNLANIYFGIEADSSTHPCS